MNNTFFSVALLVYMTAFPAVMLERAAKDAGMHLRELAHGWPLIGSCGVLVLGALSGAEMLLLLCVGLAYQSEFMHTRFVIPTLALPATLLNLVALIVFLRLTFDGIGEAVRLIKRVPAPSDSAATNAAGSRT